MAEYLIELAGNYIEMGKIVCFLIFVFAAIWMMWSHMKYRKKDGYDYMELVKYVGAWAFNIQLGLSGLLVIFFVISILMSLF